MKGTLILLMKQWFMAYQSKGGIKGVLVTGYGISTDYFSTAILNKLAKTKV